MPRLKKEDRYDRLKKMIRGEMADQNVSIEKLGRYTGYHRNTMSERLQHPETLTLYEISQIAIALDIPAEDIRSAIPIR